MSEEYEAAQEIADVLRDIRDAAPSRRERIATAVLAGLAASRHWNSSTMPGPAFVAKWATEAADALIAELDKEAT